MKKLTAALCAVLLVFCMFVPGAAAAGPALGATRAYCIIDADTGLVLAQQNMNEELHPASITKVMTLGLACEKAQGNWEDTKLTVSHEDVYSLAGTDSSHIALLEGEEVPLTDALYATQMASANDGANLLAEYFLYTPIDVFSQVGANKLLERFPYAESSSSRNSNTPAFTNSDYTKPVFWGE